MSEGFRKRKQIETGYKCTDINMDLNHIISSRLDEMQNFTKFRNKLKWSLVIEKGRRKANETKFGKSENFIVKLIQNPVKESMMFLRRLFAVLIHFICSMLLSLF